MQVPFSGTSVRRTGLADRFAWGGSSRYGAAVSIRACAAPAIAAPSASSGRARTIGALLASSLCACSGTCHRGNPYVPFLEDASTTAAQDGSVVRVDAPSDGNTGASFATVKATLAPQGTTKWSLSGMAFEAPPGQYIIAALVADVDGDGQRDVVAYLQPTGGGGGELRFFRGSLTGMLPSRAVGGAVAGVDVSLPAPCFGRPSLTLVGPHSVTLDLRPMCGDAAPASRRFFYAAFAPTASIRWAARVAEPPAGLTFEIEGNATDLDGDGVDDPTFRITLAGNSPPLEPGDPLVARLRYWDRPSGLSRDHNEPELSFQLIGNRASMLAGKKTSAHLVPSIVKRLRLLHGGICREGSPWLEPSGERGIECGKSLGVHLATIGQARSALTLGDVVDAAGLREHVAGNSGWSASKPFSALDQELRKAAPELTATLREVTALPSTPSKGAPAWGALSFEASGALLVRTVTGVTRVELNGTEAEATDVPSWPWEIQWPDGKDARLAGTAGACDSPWITARIAGHDVKTGTTYSPLPLLPRIDRGRCVDGRAPSLTAVPIGWTEPGLLALVDGEIAVIPREFGTPGSAPAYGSAFTASYVRGAPRSPNGAFFVTPTRLGLLRRNEGASTFARIVVSSLDGIYLSLRECAISNDGARIACLRDTRAVVIDVGGSATPSPPTPSASASASADGESI